MGQSKDPEKGRQGGFGIGSTLGSDWKSATAKTFGLSVAFQLVPVYEIEAANNSAKAATVSSSNLY